jgi:O-acetyl-ADP-ribose deacetylase (regulator of RNase III)
MGKGFAAEIRRKFPAAYLAYAQLHHDHGLVLGEWLAVNCDEYCIFHAFTQEYYGKDRSIVYVDYGAVDKTMREAAKMAKTLGLKIYLPLIGGGVANGEHGRLFEIFKSAYSAVDATLVLPIGYTHPFLNDHNSKEAP